MLSLQRTLCTQKGHADYLVLRRGTHYVLTEKGNQPTPAQPTENLPWTQIPTAHTSSGRAHGRMEQRIVKVVLSRPGSCSHTPRQAIQITRKTRRFTSKNGRPEVVYAIPSLTAEQATADELAEWAAATGP
jgi:hypothetical protein